jgi:hypothetical protein
MWYRMHTLTSLDIHAAAFSQLLRWQSDVSSRTMFALQATNVGKTLGFCSNRSEIWTGAWYLSRSCKDTAAALPLIQHVAQQWTSSRSWLTKALAACESLPDMLLNQISTKR